MFFYIIFFMGLVFIGTLYINGTDLQKWFILFFLFVLFYITIYYTYGQPLTAKQRDSREEGRLERMGFSKNQSNFIKYTLTGFLILIGSFYFIVFTDISLFKKGLVVCGLVLLYYVYSYFTSKKRPNILGGITTKLKKDPEGDIKIQDLPNGYIAFRPN